MEFDLSSLLQYHEGNRLEAKEASVGLPRSLWETYSAFANTEGGLIVLGVREKRGALEPVGVANPEGLVKQLWDALNNEAKVSANILANQDVRVEEVEEERVVVIRVPRADHDTRPVFINGNPLTGTFRRNGEGDYRCRRLEVNAMLRDNSDGVQDRRVLPLIPFEALCADTIRRYRNALAQVRPEHPWLTLGNEEFLLRIGAVGRAPVDGLLHPTRAGLLMFGYAYEIACEFPLYSMEYREVMGDARWDDRIVTNDGEWSGNVFDFWRTVLPLIQGAAKRPFALDGAVRVDDTPLHKALREALVNTLVHADYYGELDTVVTRTPHSLTFRNPGTVRIDPEVAQIGGISSQRNPALMVMFNLIGIGERAGAGFDTMRQGCRWAGIADPTFRELLSPDRVELAFVFGDEEGADREQFAAAVALDAGGLPTADGANDLVGKGAASQGVISASPEELVLACLAAKGSVSRGDVEALIGLSRSSAGNLLAGLMRKGRIVSRGNGRATRYELA